VAAPSCTASSYAYAGLVSNQARKGIKATVTALAPAQVAKGHVAAWIGVGGPESGVNGEAEWLQTGINGFENGSSELYLEVTRPGSSPEYTTIVPQIVPGRSYRLAVLELAGRPDQWQVYVNGKPAGGPVALPASKRFQPMAMSESWNGGTPTCNGFAYSFDRLQVASKPNLWKPLTDATTLTDAGYRVSDKTTAGFTAHSG
jgi:hypothetical protein